MDGLTDGIDGNDKNVGTVGTDGKIATDLMQSVTGNFISWFFMWVDR